VGRNNKKGTVRPIRPGFPTESAQLTITAYTERPPALYCTGDLVTALRLLTAGLHLVANSVDQMAKAAVKVEADVADKKREYMGPRGE